MSPKCSVRSNIVEKIRIEVIQKQRLIKIVQQWLQSTEDTKWTTAYHMCGLGKPSNKKVFRGTYVVYYFMLSK